VNKQAILFDHFSDEDLEKLLIGKTPQFISQAATNLVDIISEREFYDRLVKTENVRAIFNDMRRASIAPNDAFDMYKAGATICATGLDLAFGELAEICKMLKARLNFLGLITVNGYLSPSGSGFGKHIDTRGVTVVQLRGTKHWKVSHSPLEHYPLWVNYTDSTREDKLSHFVEECGYSDIILKPGDIMYLPPGIVHEAKADDVSLSLNIAFDYIGHTHADYLSVWIKKQLLGYPELREFVFASDKAENERLKIISHALGLLVNEIEQNSFAYIDKDF